jgi:thiol-disulfide isomerase/thioredoxin
LAGRITVGPPDIHGNEQPVAVSRSEAGEHYDLLFTDSNMDGSLEGESPVSTTANLSRNKWWSSFQTVLKVNHSIGESEPTAFDYPVSFWIVVENPEDQPSLLRFTRRGYKSGSVKIDGVEHIVAISDGNNDGIFGQGDYWVIGKTEKDDPLGAKDWRKIPDFTWVDETAWELTLEGTAGTVGHVLPVDPGLTREEDEISRDLYKYDREAPRAENPVVFETDFEKAIKKAANENMPYFIKFEAEWCGPCKTMSKYVFTAKEVAEAATGIVFIVVDGDKRKDLKEKYNVSGYPTCILFDTDGKEISRISGYQGVREISRFLGNLKK